MDQSLTDVLFVVRDLSPMKAIAAINPLLQKRGIATRIVLEQSRAAMLFDAVCGYSPDIIVKSEKCGPIVKGLLSSIQPRMVVAGLSHPINLEQAFAAEALDRNIPICFIDDSGGAFVRSAITPNLLLTPSMSTIEQAKELYAHQNTIYADVGYAALPKEAPEVSPQLRRKIKSLRKRHGVVAVYADYTDADGIAAYQQLDLLRSCMNIDSEGCVILKLHPKWQRDVSGAWCANLLRDHGERVYFIDDEKTDSVMYAADLMMGGSGSSLLKMAAYLAKPVIALDTPATRKFTVSQIGTEVDPVIRDIGIPFLRNPQQIFLQYHWLPPVNLRELLYPFNAAKAADVISTFVPN